MFLGYGLKRKLIQEITNLYFINLILVCQTGTLLATSGIAIGTAGKEESILEERALTMETILCLIKTLLARDMDGTNSSCRYVILFE